MSVNVKSCLYFGALMKIMNIMDWQVTEDKNAAIQSISKVQNKTKIWRSTNKHHHRADYFNTKCLMEMWHLVLTVVSLICISQTNLLLRYKEGLFIPFWLVRSKTVMLSHSKKNKKRDDPLISKSCGGETFPRCVFSVCGQDAVLKELCLSGRMQMFGRWATEVTLLKVKRKLTAKNVRPGFKSVLRLKYYW